MKPSYEENITDIIHAFHDLETLSPADVLAIKEIALNYNVNIPSYELYNLFESIRYRYENVLMIALTDIDNKREIWWLTKIG